MCSYVARNGHLEVLKWASPWDLNTCAQAAKNGHLEVLNWARENSCSWDEGIYKPEMLKCPGEDGCLWGEYNLEGIMWMKTSKHESHSTIIITSKQTNN